MLEVFKAVVSTCVCPESAVMGSVVAKSGLLTRDLFCARRTFLTNAHGLRSWLRICITIALGHLKTTKVTIIANTRMPIYFISFLVVDRCLCFL